MVILNQSRLFELAPRALPIYREAFVSVDLALGPFGILDNAHRAAHFCAQVLHETGGLRVAVENLNYTAERLMVVWPRRFQTLAAARPFAHNPRALANKTYGGRMGNVEPDDGWRYIGRGMLQLTGRESYLRVGTALDLDLVGSPELVLLPQNLLPVAGEIWREKGCNRFADLDDVVRVTRAINGGQIGLPDRRQWLAKARSAVESDDTP